MTSDPKFTEAYVWTWLPGQTKPVVAGLLSARGEQLLFNYGRSYIERKDAIALYQPELPLRSGILPLLTGLNMNENDYRMHLSRKATFPVRIVANPDTTEAGAPEGRLPRLEE